jgi:hypothetical protein
MFADLPPEPALRLASAAVLPAFVGETRTLNGGLDGTSVLAGVRVRIERDVWPYDGRWRPAANGTTNDRGAFAIEVRTYRNTRYRAVAAGLKSRYVTVHASLLWQHIRSTDLGSSFRATYGFRAPRGADLPERTYFYVHRLGRKTVRLTTSAPLREVRPGHFETTVRLPYARPKRQTAVLYCYREPKPDAWGPVKPLDKRCGNDPLRIPDD